MKLIIDVPGGFLRKIQELIQKGKYLGIEEFLEVALLNQLKLEENGKTEDNFQITLQSEVKEYARSNAAHSMTTPVSVNLFQKDQYDSIVPVDLPSDNFLPDGPLWGQYNRIFPIKIALRLLANSLLQKPEVELEHFREYASDISRRMGIQLLDIDKTKKRTRGERLSTALPVGDNPFKSKNRFKNHFIGYVNNKKVFQGAPAKLKLVSFYKNNAYNISLTKPGLEFALIKNPILDINILNNNSLSEEETSYYLEHIKNYVPNEYEAVIFTLRNISEGKNRPDILTQILQDKYTNWTKSKANTVRSGLLSRMFELGLINRYRLGLREIEYAITENGGKILKLYLNRVNG